MVHETELGGGLRRIRRIQHGRGRSGNLEILAGVAVQDVRDGCGWSLLNRARPRLDCPYAWLVGDRGDDVKPFASPPRCFLNAGERLQGDALRLTADGARGLKVAPPNVVVDGPATNLQELGCPIDRDGLCASHIHKVSRARVPAPIDERVSEKSEV